MTIKQMIKKAKYVKLGSSNSDIWLTVQKKEVKEKLDKNIFSSSFFHLEERDFGSILFIDIKNTTRKGDNFIVKQQEVISFQHI